MLGRMPIVRNVYRALKQIFESAVSATGPNASFQKVGLIEFPSKGMWSLVFVTGETTGEIPTVNPGGETDLSPSGSDRHRAADRLHLLPAAAGCDVLEDERRGRRQDHHLRRHGDAQLPAQRAAGAHPGAHCRRSLAPPSEPQSATPNIGRAARRARGQELCLYCVLIAPRRHPGFVIPATSGGDPATASLVRAR